MDQVHVIRHKVLVEGQPIRQVAREMAISRNTVRKYLKEPEPKRAPDRQPRSRPVLERVAPRIEELLSEWSVRTTAKQRITGTRLHRQLVEEGEQVGVTTVRQYLREKRRQVAEVYIPLVHRAGDAAQVDFFEVTVDVAGVRRAAWKFVMRLMHSGWDFAWIYDRCDQVSFLDGHVRALAQLGGVPARLVYDNLSLAVRKMTFPDRKLTERFQALASAYLFEPCFTRPGQGHDKGGVEARGKGIRLQHLTPIPHGESLREISEQLLQDLETQAGRKRRRDGQTVREKFEQERQLLRPLPAVPFDPRAVEPVTVSRSALVRVQGAQYSVPSHWKLLEATAYVGVEQVSIVCRGEETVVAKQPKGTRRVQYRHYHQELARKPAAVRQVAPELIAELGEPYDRLYRMLQDAHGGLGAARVLAKILGAIGEHGEEPVREALMAALELDRVDLLGLGKKVHQESRPRVVVVPDQLKGIEVQSARATDYDWMLAGGAV